MSAGELRVRVPARMVRLLGEVVWAVRAGRGWIPASDCLARAARHFIDTWDQPLKERNTLQKRLLERDGGLCQVPGCSRAAVHAHHVPPGKTGRPSEVPPRSWTT